MSKTNNIILKKLLTQLTFPTTKHSAAARWNCELCSAYRRLHTAAELGLLITSYKDKRMWYSLSQRLLDEWPDL